MKTISLLFAIWVAAACSGAATGPDHSGGPLRPVQLAEALGGIEFDKPVALVFPEDGAETGYIVEQSGRILSVSILDDSWSVTGLLNVEDRVSDRGREEGLLGLALDPHFPSSGYLYVNYTASDPRRTVVSRYAMSSDDPSVAEPDSETIILEVRQPYSNHNGGSLLFGPDGLLYIGLGDGGAAGDPRNNGQDPGTLLGSIARVDVSELNVSGGYSVPVGNPFVGVEGARSEIWAYGLRNPWRFTFDRLTGELWAADVGQNQREEVNLIVPGSNYGWNIMEGSICFRGRSNSCDREGLELPVVEYAHDEGCSITGGYVYRGNELPWLHGKYVYGDFCSGKIWAFEPDKGQAEELIDTGLKISSFAEDPRGELYVLSLDGGVYTLVGGESSAE